MNWEQFGEGFRTLYMLLSGALNVYLFFKARTDERFGKIVERLELIDTDMAEEHEFVRTAVAERKANHAEHETRLQVLESNIETIPTHADLDRIRQDISNIRKDVGTVDERSKIQLDSLRRIENHLLSRG